jgi:hypothetical protein
MSSLKTVIVARMNSARQIRRGGVIFIAPLHRCFCHAQQLVGFLWMMQQRVRPRLGDLKARPTGGCLPERLGSESKK